jgi:hypothetical protein
VPSLYEQVIAAHRKTLDRVVERGAVERLRNVYTKAAAEVLAKLEKLGPGSTSFTAYHLHRALAQLKAGQLYIDDQMLGELNAASREAQIESVHGLVRDYKKLEKHFSGHEPVLPIEEAARFAGVIDKSRPSLMRQHATSMNRYGSQMVERFQGEMAVGLASGDTLDGVIGRVHGVMKSDFWRAERVARTEVAWAANSSHAEGIKEIAKEDGGVMSQWIEFCGPDGKPLDDRVGIDSIALHGELVTPGGDFIMPADAPYPDAKGNMTVPPALVGQSWKVPPCRPNGRETIQVWKKEWGAPGWLYQGGKRHWLVK